MEFSSFISSTPLEIQVIFLVFGISINIINIRLRIYTYIFFFFGSQSNYWIIFHYIEYQHDTNKIIFYFFWFSFETEWRNSKYYCVPTSYLRFVILEELLKRDRILAVIPRLSTEWKISFTLRLTSLTASNEYCNVIHFTQSKDSQEVGDRIAAVWLMIGTGSVFSETQYFSGINGNIGVLPLISLPVFEINVPVDIEFHQRYLSGGKYRVSLMINGQEIASEINSQARQFYDVKLYASNPWYDPCSGYIKNLAFTNFL